MELTRDNLNRLTAEVLSPSGPAATTRAFNAAMIEAFRTNGGELSGDFANSRMLLLTTRGAVTGLERTTPLAYTKIDGRICVIASMGGAPTDPAWFRNLVAHPEVTVERGAETYRARAVVAVGYDRDKLFAKAMAKIPIFAEYQKRTTRIIPVIELVPIEEPDSN